MQWQFKNLKINGLITLTKKTHDPELKKASNKIQYSLKKFNTHFNNF